MNGINEGSKHPWHQGCAAWTWAGRTAARRRAATQCGVGRRRRLPPGRGSGVAFCPEWLQIVGAVGPAACLPATGRWYGKPPAWHEAGPADSDCRGLDAVYAPAGESFRSSAWPECSRSRRRRLRRYRRDSFRRRSGCSRLRRRRIWSPTTVPSHRPRHRRSCRRCGPVD